MAGVLLSTPRINAKNIAITVLNTNIARWMVKAMHHIVEVARPLLLCCCCSRYSRGMYPRTDADDGCGR